MSEPGQNEEQPGVNETPVEESAEEKELKALATEFVAVNDELINLRTKTLEQFLEQNGLSLERAIDDPESDDAAALELAEEELRQLESTEATSWLGYNLTPGLPKRHIYFYSPLIRVSIVEPGEGEDTIRAFAVALPSGKDKLISITFDGKEDEEADEIYQLEKLFNSTDKELAGKVKELTLEEARAEVGFVRWLRKYVGGRLYGRPVQPTDPGPSPVPYIPKID